MSNQYFVTVFERPNKTRWHGLPVPYEKAARWIEQDVREAGRSRPLYRLRIKNKEQQA